MIKIVKAEKVAAGSLMDAVMDRVNAEVRVAYAKRTEERAYASAQRARMHVSEAEWQVREGNLDASVIELLKLEYSRSAAVLDQRWTALQDANAALQDARITERRVRVSRFFSAPTLNWVANPAQRAPKYAMA